MTGSPLPPIPVLRVTTRPLPHPGILTEWVSATNPLAFLRRGFGLVGRGPSLTQAFSGPNRIHQASAWWKGVSENATVDDAVGVWGSGLVAFGTMTFSPASAMPSVLVIPHTIIGASDGVAWRTEITVVGNFAEHADTATSTIDLRPIRPAPLASLNWAPGQMSEALFLDTVTTAIAKLRAGDANKVVLARDLVATTNAPADWRLAIARLTERYPDTHTFAIDGLVGASPETLVRLKDHHLHTRVLAGSIARGGNEHSDQEAAEALHHSTKDLDEHRFAVHSAVEALKTLTPHVVADDMPFTLKLPNLWHLATDIAATLPETASGLDAVAALHPTAAVAGSPTPEALDLIAELEPFDRGRYAGPVGWIDQQGDGEWAIALRCAQWSEGTITAYAGAGIVSDSSPESELLETGLKFKPIVEAFG